MKNRLSLHQTLQMLTCRLPVCIALAVLACSSSQRVPQAETIGANGQSDTRFEPRIIAFGAEQGFPSEVRLRGVHMNFYCPAAYKGKADPEKFATRYCQVTVTYPVLVRKELWSRFAFVYAGDEDLLWSFQRTIDTGRTVRTVYDTIITSSFEVRDGLRWDCTFCPPAVRSQRMSIIPQTMRPDLQRIEIQYRQALDYVQEGVGLFSSGHWVQGFMYELWPKAGWDWEYEIDVVLRLAIEARPGLLGIGFKKDDVTCTLREGRKIMPVKLSGGDAVEPIMPRDNPTGIERPEGRLFTAELKLQKKSQRLSCTWS